MNASKIAVLLTASLLLGSAGAQQKLPIVKPPIRGLVTMGDISIISDPAMPQGNSTAEASAHPGVYSAVVIVVRWSHLEPARGKFDFSEVDNALKQIRAYNTKYPKTPVVGKLRVFGGPNAPAWAKAIDGGPVDLTKKGKPLIIGKFWTAEYTQAWRELQVALAAKYDADPLIEEVAISSCGSTSAEPFVMAMLEPNIPAFKAAGFSDAQMQACLLGAIDDYVPWKRVALDYTANGYRTYKTEEHYTDGPWNLRPEFTAQVLEEFRRRLGPRAVVANHGLADTVDPAQAPVLAELKKLGPPMEFQTANWKGNFDHEVKDAKSYGATEFEMWDTKDTGKGVGISYDQIKAWTKLFPYTNMLGAQK